MLQELSNNACQSSIMCRDLLKYYQHGSSSGNYVCLCFDFSEPDFADNVLESLEGRVHK